ncbi:mannosyl-D-glycerate utilization repressor MngR [Vibrio variabilis]|uniref:Mannosyl-D-glycerate utilization repressor MngR n=1 Tax=Vibrio variabilis TaxID=990271 RepID=A0ABQ0JNA6_9VIBR|nr:mannosyl-D-glycerate utilization repressor MngR [Vibrio variabilis]
MDPAQPIIEKRTRSHLQDDTVFEYSRNYFKSSEYKFTLVAKTSLTLINAVAFLSLVVQVQALNLVSSRHPIYS